MKRSSWHLKRFFPFVGALSIALLGLTACRSAPKRAAVFSAPGPDKRFVVTTNAVPDQLFTAEIKSPAKQYAAQDVVSNFSANAVSVYHLGPGDKFAFLVRGRADISLPSVIVSPDGDVALPLAGILHVGGRTLREVTDQVRTLLAENYDKPEVTLVMQEYNNNEVFVLGRVAKPGAVHMGGQSTLLEALSLAGGLPVDTQKSFLSRCMIVRGKELALWIDLAELLDNGNLALNARLQNGDLIFIPQSDDQVAHVMGEVNSPGVLLLRSQLTVLDAVTHAGGLTKNANLRHAFLVRAKGEQGVVQDIDLNEIILRGDLRRNYVLRDGDILYVSETGMSKFNYFMTQLLPAMKAIDFTLTNAERIGAMAELRAKLWGQSGFVNGGTGN
jgi:polysaccharide export outer membrane protein